MNAQLALGRVLSAKFTPQIRCSKPNMLNVIRMVLTKSHRSADTAPRRHSSGQSKSRAGVSDEPSREIVFQFDDQAAKEVLLAGSFTQWDREPIPMARNEAGVWQARVRLPVGRYVYKFVVDGQWNEERRVKKHSENPPVNCDNVLEVF